MPDQKQQIEIKRKRIEELQAEIEKEVNEINALQEPPPNEVAQDIADELNRLEEYNNEMIGSIRGSLNKLIARVPELAPPVPTSSATHARSY